MAKQLLKVQTVYGTFTRRTERAYKFVVVTLGRSEAALAEWNRQLVKHYQNHVKYYQELLDKPETRSNAMIDNKWQPMTEEWLKSQLQAFQEALEGAADEYQHSLVTNSKIIAGKQGIDAGWSSRLELARRLAAQQTSAYDVKIFSLADGQEVK